MTAPVSGMAVSQLLSRLPGDLVWCIEDIETLTDTPSTDLGDLWWKVRRGPTTIANSELSSVISQARQVIALSIESVDDEHIRLVIDDGELIVPLVV